MTFIIILPIILSGLLSAAHFYRSGNLLLTAISILVPFLLISRNRWVPRIVTVSLLLAACEWFRTMYVLIGHYQAAGVSWTRLAIILTGVAMFTALSSLIFRTSQMKKRYQT